MGVANSRVSTGGSDVGALVPASLPPVDGRCVLLEQPDDCLEEVLHLLRVRDLSRLARTCRYLKSLVGGFVKHKGVTPISRYEEFFAANRTLMTYREQQFHARLNEAEKNSEQYWWAVCKIAEQFGENPGYIRRISISDEQVWFAHRENPRYIVVEPDDLLSRKVTVVRSVCWLEFRASFADLAPGAYQISLRLKILDREFNFPHRKEDQTEFILSSQEFNSINIKKNVDWWKAIRRGEMAAVHKEADPDIAVEVDSQNSCLGPGQSRDWFRLGASSMANASGKWVSLTLPTVRLADGEQEINFRFLDKDCPFWKGGIVFDFIQLKKIV